VSSREPDGLLVRLATDALKALGLRPERLAPLIDPRRAHEPVSALLDAAELVTGNPDLGIDLGYATTIRALSPVVYLMMSGPTLAAALRDMTRYAPVAVHRPTTATLVEEADTTAFVFGPELGGRTYTEYLAALLVRLFRYLVDDMDMRPVAVRFTHPPPPDPSARHPLFGTNISWDQPRNAIVLDRAQVELPCAHASEELHAVHERALHEALQAELRDTLLVRVREALAQNLSQQPPTMARVARAIGLGERTLQRRLGERGTSFEQLFQDVRRQRTLELLAQDSLSIQAVALETGYHDASSFHRAFRAWTGVTPAVYRARLRATADEMRKRDASSGDEPGDDSAAAASAISPVPPLDDAQRDKTS
jgi:AraC-like DNA-binding protein